MRRMIMRTLAASIGLAAVAMLASGCYSSSDKLTSDGRDTPDAPPDADADTDVPWPDVPPDTVWPDVPPDTVWPDVPPDVDPDPPWPDVPPDVPPDPTDPDVPPGGIVGDACTSWSDCTGMPSPSADCWWDILGYLRFPGGYCSADCYADW
jgi:hypothetical protein